MPFSLRRWKYGGRYPSRLPIRRRPFDGPASQASKPASDAQMSAIAITGVIHCIPKCAKTASNACITPAVRLSVELGTIQLIASAGRMKIANTSGIDTNIARGNSFAGLRSSLTCTAFISMPA